MKTVSVETMRWLDAATIAGGVPGDELMARAGIESANLIRGELARGAWGHVERLVVLAGKGNNGGDGYVVARAFAERGQWPVQVYATCPVDDLRGEAAYHARLLPDTVPLGIGDELPAHAFRRGDLIVDALLGTGASGPPRPPCDSWIRQVNASGCPVVSLDIPSGLNGDTGEAEGAVVQADLTVTMALPKTGMLAPAGRPFCGRIRCVDIGIPDGLVEQASATGAALLADDIRPFLPRRSFAAHKGTCGWVLVLGGSQLYGGAPLLAGAAALRAGAGLVTVARPVGAARFQPPSLSLIVRDLPDGGTGFLGPETFRFLDEQLGRTQAVVFGPGAGTEQSVGEVLARVLAAPVPVVLDADGLRLLARRPELTETVTGELVLTPHPGEMRALLSGFDLDELLEAPRRDQARALADRAGAVVLLKGLGTVIATPDGRDWVCTSGSPALATAGTGDVLAGIVGSLLGQGLTAANATCAGAFVHGLAGELWPQAVRSLTADDLLTLIPRAMREISPLA
jgi:NAD(P)H-hydrate epimerase